MDHHTGVAKTIFTPHGVTSLRNAVNVFAGPDFSAAITGGQGYTPGSPIDYGDLWMWGSADCGKLGLGEAVSSGSMLVPERVELPLPAWRCALGQSHTVILTPTGEAYAWGAGYYGRLGIGTSSNVYSPKRVAFPDEVRLMAVAAGAFHTMAISTEKDLWIWGRKNATCSSVHYLNPAMMLQLYSSEGVPKVKAIAAAGEHSIAVADDGTAFVWGGNKNFELGLGKKAAEHLDSPDSISTLPTGVDVAVTGPAHSVLILDNGDVFSFGATGAGRLGIGWTKSMHQSAPTLVVANWSATEEQAKLLGGEGDIAGGGTGEDTIENPMGVKPEALHYFLSQLTQDAYSPEPTISWSEVQDFLVKEDIQCRPAQIRAFEDDIIAILGRHLDFILSLPEKEAELKRQEGNFESKLLGVVARLDLERARDEMPSAPPMMANKMADFGRFAVILQQQPAYLMNLLVSAQRPAHRAVVKQLVVSLFWETDNSRVEHLMQCLFRLIAQREVTTATGIRTCFDPASSGLFFLMDIFCTRQTYLLSYAKYFLDVNTQNSAAAVLLHKAEESFAMSAAQVAAERGFPSLANLNDTQKAEVHQGLHAGLQNIRKFLTDTMCRTLQSVPFPCILQSILVDAQLFIYQRGFAIEYELSQYGYEFCNSVPLIKLVLNGVLEPILRDPQTAAARCGFSPIPEHVVTKFQRCAELLHMTCANMFSPAEVTYILKGIGMECWAATVVAIRNQIAAAKGFLDTELTLDIFRAHLDRRQHTVFLRSDTMATSVNLCKLYEANLNMSAFDPLAEVVSQISNDRRPPFPEDVVATCQATPTWHSFNMDPRFLLSEKNLAYCSISRVPLPQRLAYRQLPSVEAGQRLMAVIQRYPCPHELDPRYILQNCLRKVPPVTARTWDKLQTELNELTEFYTSQETPNYKAANSTQLAAGVACEMSQQKIPEADVMRWITLGILGRKRHTIYLSSIYKNETHIEDLRAVYTHNLKKQMRQLEQATDAAQTLAYEGPIARAAQRFRIKLRMTSLAKALGKRDSKISLRPSATISFAVLWNEGVVSWVSPVFGKNDLVDLHFTFSQQASLSWAVVVIKKTVKHDLHVGEEIFSLAKLQDFRRMNIDACVPIMISLTHPQGLFQINVHTLLKILMEIHARFMDSE
eukprot:GHVT01068350.1.p1 GENE.GHVT01068350.1~~GHVT01068350.1.p1  ORF type:complete len:1152 (-),score=80.80 GHVT01068350.1:2645-6100(-)